MGKVLVVDDEIAVRGVMGEFLKHWGYESLTAEDGATGLELIQDERPDIVILDFFLPDMVACEFVSRLKEMHPDLPVIMITSFWFRLHAKLVMEDGACAYVPKPIDFTHLLETIDFWLNRQARN